MFSANVGISRECKVFYSVLAEMIATKWKQESQLAKLRYKDVIIT